MKNLVLTSMLLVIIGCSNPSENNTVPNSSDEVVENTTVEEQRTPEEPIVEKETTTKTEETKGDEVKETENDTVTEEDVVEETTEDSTEESTPEEPVEEIVEEAVPYCGDGKIDPDNEDCDGTRLNGERCTTLGYDTGILTCTSTCRFDESQCVYNEIPTAICGNYRVEDGEECEGNIPPGAADCKYYGYDHGYVTCTNCKVNTSPCYNDEPEPTCATDCGPNAGCVNGECTCKVMAYGQRFENCDGDWSNGCETPVNRTFSCGTCGNLDQCNQLEECIQNPTEETWECKPFGDNDCNEANPENSGCTTHEIEWCVCSREGHSECCALPHGWTQECAEVAMVECVDVQTGRRPCDEATLNPGCNDSVIEQCVVADGGTNCENYWSAGCVSRAKNACEEVFTGY